MVGPDADPVVADDGDRHGNRLKQRVEQFVHPGRVAVVVGVCRSDQRESELIIRGPGLRAATSGVAIGPISLRTCAFSSVSSASLGSSPAMRVT